MNNKKYALPVIILFILLLWGGTASAAPIRNKTVTLVQPDGTEIQCLLSGDEYFNYYHDTSGNFIIPNEEGYYVYADIIEGIPVPGATIVTPENLQVIQRSPSDISKSDSYVDIHQLDLDKLIDPNKYSNPSSSTESASPRTLKDPSLRNAPITGPAVNLVIYIRFSDEAEFVTPTLQVSIDSKLNTGPQNVRSYMRTLSFGSVDLTSAYYPKSGASVFSYQDPYPRSYYSPGGENGYKTEEEMRIREHTLLKNAVDSISAQIESEFSSSQLDRNGDGFIDSVCFIISGAEQGWSDMLWPHQWALYTFPTMVHDKYIYKYSFQFSGTEATVFSHETCHVFGLPDLYRYDQPGYPVFAWDIMGRGDFNMTNSYTRWANGGWGTIHGIERSGSYALKDVLSVSANEPMAYLLKGKSPEYFLVEYRKNMPAGSIDAVMPTTELTDGQGGLLVYRIDATRNANGNMNGPPDNVYLLRPNETQPNTGIDEPWDAWLSPYIGNTSFGSDVQDAGYVQNSLYYYTNAENSGIVISNVVIDPVTDILTFDVQFNYPPITSLALEESSIELECGSGRYLTPILQPAETGEENIIWTSSNDAIATVSSDGFVIAKDVGTVTIQATSKDDASIYATSTVVCTRFDLNDDFSINLLDLIICARNYGSTPTEGDYNTDGIVNIFDLMQVAIRVNSTTLSLISEGANGTYTLLSGYDDVYGFIPTTTGTYTITTISNLDTLGNVYDIDTTLASDDDSGAGTNFSITIDLVADTTYYVAVKGYDDQETGEYSIIVNR